MKHKRRRRRRRRRIGLEEQSDYKRWRYKNTLSCIIKCEV